MPRLVGRVLKFVVVLCVTTVLVAVVWQNTAANLYDCTDEVLPGYFEFGWVHDQPGRPVKAVAHVMHGRDMGEPDTIKEGWSVPGLWRLWLTFFGASLVISAAAAVPWTFPAPGR